MNYEGDVQPQRFWETLRMARPNRLVLRGIEFCVEMIARRKDF